MAFTSYIQSGGMFENAMTVLSAMVAFFVIWSIGNSLTTRDRLGPRLKAIQDRRNELREAYLEPKRRKRSMSSSTGWMRQVLDRVQLISGTELATVERKLAQAGYRTKDAVVVFRFAKLVCPLLGLITTFFVWRSGVEGLTSLFAMGVPLLIGLRLPDVLLTNKKQKRYKEIRKGLSDTLDLMLICAEAGLSLAASLTRVVKELGQVYPEMAEELSLTSAELGFLPDRNQALVRFADRVDMPEVRSMVNVLLQTEKFGTPIAQALRVLSRDFRTERMLRAEQKAARLPAMMTVPMIVFILPTMFILVMAPAIIQVMNTK